ncbi:HAMP domain-containing sensor histidine kinase [Nocardia sp. NBC_01329]|uniref:HAMP domain-containing sensor histidine kinase n=1 Tax=Nocardia sp. NBC_01329 TaxID=2903594 RepID=UPI002E10E6E0|nr:HAMP domain-containing histidine kinase [Nocardia sp. NBC_01329]
MGSATSATRIGLDAGGWGLRSRVTTAFAASSGLMALALVLGVFAVISDESRTFSDRIQHRPVLLLGCAMVAALVGAAVGVWVSRRMLKPLHDVAAAAALIASGELDTRLPHSNDQDLASTVDSFNRMVESLQRRIDREHRLFGDVSHELRTPLTTLTTAVDVLNRYREEMPPRSRRALELVSAEVDHLRRLLDDLLALARVEAGMHHGPADPVSVGELVAHTLHDSHRPARLLDVRDDVTVRGRKLELERAVVNLLKNADRHGGGAVAVTVRRDGGDAVVEVDDAGPGVAPVDRERIFERFATSRTGRRSATGGTGIGLALVAETVAIHHGRVECDERPGGGARFIIRLPVIQ